MRIVAGSLGGHPLLAPANRNIRPTPDRVRESLFAILESRHGEILANARVIDLFAGTGALGLEALSRGAKYALFVEQSREGLGLIRNNINNLNIKKQTGMRSADATRLGPLGKLAPFDIAFADPPYGKGLAEKAAIGLIRGKWLSPDALLVIEDRCDSALPFLPAFDLVDERKFGDIIVRFLKLGKVPLHQDNKITKS